MVLGKEGRGEPRERVVAVKGSTGAAALSSSSSNHLSSSSSSCPGSGRNRDTSLPVNAVPPDLTHRDTGIEWRISYCTPECKLHRAVHYLYLRG